MNEVQPLTQFAIAAATPKYRYEGPRVRAGRHDGHLYVLEYADGSIKVGRASDPTSRIRQHQAVARGRGAEVCKVWVSIPISDTLARETALIRACSETLGLARLPIGREYFQSGYMRAIEAAADVAVGAAPTPRPVRNNSLAGIMAANVRAERSRHRLFQGTLAEALGVSVSSVSDLEAGDRRVSIDELLPLCRVLQCDLPTLLKGLGPEDRATLGL